MILSDVSIKRPVAMSCLIIGLTLLGLNSYRKMGLELMPKVDVPFITVSTIYPGASPEEIETDIAKRIEDEIVSIEGLKHVTSTCMENVCLTFLEFQIGVDVDITATDVREKIDLIRSELPKDAEDPQILKYDINAKPIITLALAGDAPIDELYDYADNTLSDRISVIQGVATVDVIGGAEREVHILLDRAKLAARGLTSYQVSEMIRNSTGIIPSGRIRSRGTEYSVKFDADHTRIEEIANLPLFSINGHRSYVRDVAEVRMGTEELRQSAEVNGQPAVTIKVVKKSDANAVAVVNKIKDSLSGIESELPGGMDLIWIADDGDFTEATNRSAWINVIEGVLLTAAVLFLFLYNFRALFVVAVTMPLTIIIGLFFMNMVGFTLNTSTLIAIGMSVGILVTNSIVVLEAIVKHLDRTGDPMHAAKRGASESFTAVLASAGTNIVVLFPLSILGGMIGLFIRPFALTMLIMTVVSLFISFTLTPMLCSLLLIKKRKNTGPLHKMEMTWNRRFDQFTGLYKRYLRFIERHRTAALILLIVTGLMLFHSLFLAGQLGSAMVSEPDRGELIVKLEFPTSYALSQTREKAREAMNSLENLPHLKSQLLTMGKVEGMLGQSSEGVYLAEILLKFSDSTKRSIGIDELGSLSRQYLKNMTDAIITVNLPSAVGGSSSDVELEISGNELEQLYNYAEDIRARTEREAGFTDLDTTVRDGKPEIRIYPKRSVLSDINLPAMAMGMSLRGNIEGLESGIFKRDGRNYDIVVKYKEREGEDQVEAFTFPSPDGQPVSLAGFGDIQERRAPVQIIRKDKQRISKMFSNLTSTNPLGKAVARISQIIDNDVNFLPGYSYTFAGMYETMVEGQKELAEAAVIALILVVLTLAAILESFKQPILILVTLPLTIIGIMWALYMRQYSISIFVLMGSVMLIGIVVNNAILIMDKFNVLISEGAPRHSAMIQAATDRLRPVIMITIAAVLGMMPLAFGQGLGAEMRNDVGTASAGGIFVSGVLTLLVMPVIYNFFTRKRSKASED